MISHAAFTTEPCGVNTHITLGRFRNPANVVVRVYLTRIYKLVHKIASVTTMDISNAGFLSLAIFKRNSSKQIYLSMNIIGTLKFPRSEPRYGAVLEPGTEY